jgi:Bacterial Ig-like domain (group 3)
VNGTGQTIGIINESNIDLSLVSAYQQLFGLANHPTQVVIDGDDPGTLSGVDTEAYLDVEVSGAVAPNATVNLYISNGSDFQDPISLAALRAVEDNQASVLSVSFGNCEASLGNAGNQFWSGLWEQAAAQGQTVLVATGDTGPECNFGLGISVSGFASTPWNVAVGGTDFYYSDYATGGASATTLWNQTNNSNLGSLKAPLPEQVWNDPFGLDIISTGLQRNEIFSGGGGASSCSTQSSSTGDCTAGYPKPNWQTGPGVPADGVRDIPDVSLFASNGANLSAYPICAFAGECISSAGSEVEVLLAGGTSGSSPAMAGTMALVNQKYGRQGQANFTLYPLAQQKPTAFHDITLGSNDSVCLSGTTDCVVNANGDNVTTVYSAAPGYDLASGLGSVDANELVNSWNSITFLPTTTTLGLSSSKITHGTPITLTTSVAPASGSGTPSGGVAILTTSTLPSSPGQTVLTLSGGTASSSVDSFPGGYYNVSASYHGDAVFGSSTSSPAALTVAPENSNINFSVLNGQNRSAMNNGSSLQYNVPLSLVIQPVGVSAPSGTTNGKATGRAAFTVDSITGSSALNGAGIASWTPPALAIGNHTASASYSGDASFNASSASPITFTVTKGVPWLNLVIDALEPPPPPGYNVSVGGSLTVTTEVGPFYGSIATGSVAPLGTAAPTGTVTMCLGPDNISAACISPNYSQTANLTSPTGANAQYASATVTFTNLAAGSYLPTATYNGDAHWQSQGEILLTTINVISLAPLAPSTTNLSITPASIAGTEVATFTSTIAGSGSSGVAPTGEVDYYNNGTFLTYVLLGANSGNTISFSFQLNSSPFWNSGANQITAIYDGDSNYQPSTSNVVNINVTQGSGDFTLSPQLPQITVQAGASGTVGVNLTSLNNFSGAVTLTCTPSSSNLSCSVNPASPTLHGAATAMLAITASAQAAALPSHHDARDQLGWLGAGGFALASVLLTGFADRRRRMTILLGLGLLAALFAAPGCGGGQGGQNSLQPPPPPPNTATYSVVVSGTANGIVHNAKVLVAVQ